MSFTALREIKILQETDHENVAKLLDVFYLQKTIFLVLEYVPYDIHSLYTRKASEKGLILREEHVKNIMQQVLRGLHYLHETQFIMHRVPL